MGSPVSTRQTALGPPNPPPRVPTLPSQPPTGTSSSHSCSQQSATTAPSPDPGHRLLAIICPNRRFALPAHLAHALAAQPPPELHKQLSHPSPVRTRLEGTQAEPGCSQLRNTQVTQPQGPELLLQADLSVENQGQPSLFQEGSSPISHLCDEGCFSNNEDNHTSVLLQPPSPCSCPPPAAALLRAPRFPNTQSLTPCSPRSSPSTPARCAPWTRSPWTVAPAASHSYSATCECKDRFRAFR